MHNTAQVMFGFIVWAIALGALLVAVRIGAIARGHHYSFDPAGNDVTGFAQRVTRAYNNVLANISIPLALLLYAIATSQTAITDGLACWVLLARVGQSCVHMISTNLWMVRLRALIFVIQQTIFVIWIWKFCQALV